MTVERLPKGNFPARPSKREWHFDLSQLPAKDIPELLRTLRRRMGVLLVTMGIVTVLVTAIVFTVTPLYTATSSVLIETEAQQGSDLEALVTGNPADKERIESEVAVMTSRDFAERVIKRLQLVEKAEFNPALRTEATWEDFFSPITSLFASDEESSVPSAEEEFDVGRIEIIDRLLARIKVVQRPNTYVLDVSATSESPMLAAQLANTISDLYIVEQLEAKFDATKRATDWLTTRLADMRQDLERSEAAVEQYRSSAGLLQTGGGGETTLVQQQVANVNAKLIDARIRRSEIEERLRQVETLIKSGNASTAGEVMASPLVQALRAQEAEVRRRIAEMSQRVGTDHPTLRAARAELADVQGKLGGAQGNVIESLRSEVAVARAQEAGFEKQMADLESKLSGVNAKEGELRILQREAEASRTLYETYLGRYKEREDQDKIQRPDARVISRADVPLGASFPNKPVIIFLALLASLVLGVLIVALLEQFDRGIRSMQEVYRYLELPCLGLVPTVSQLQLAGKTPENYVIWKPTSAYAESVRSLRTGILLSDQDVKPRVIVMTSARPNEGKTAISCAMARINALGGRRTILVDLDLRKPEIHKRLPSARPDGIAEYLSGQASLQDVVQKDAQSGVEFIVAGRPVANCGELLRSSQLETLIDQLSQGYDLVVLDAPPVLAVADTRLIARLAQKTVFVVRWAETPREVVKLALRQLADAGADIAGVVISMVDVKQNAKYGFGDSETYTGVYKRYYVG
jgi:polysaccharide biosynthesis transport protein